MHTTAITHTPPGSAQRLQPRPTASNSGVTSHAPFLSQSPAEVALATPSSTNNDLCIATLLVATHTGLTGAPPLPFFLSLSLRASTPLHLSAHLPLSPLVHPCPAEHCSDTEQRSRTKTKRVQGLSLCLALLSSRQDPNAVVLRGAFDVRLHPRPARHCNGAG